MNIRRWTKYPSQPQTFSILFRAAHVYNPETPIFMQDLLPYRGATS